MNNMMQETGRFSGFILLLGRVTHRLYIRLYEFHENLSLLQSTDYSNQKTLLGLV